MLKKCSILATFVTGLMLGSGAVAAPSKAVAAGDSITMGFAADCTGNVNFFDLLCLLGGDQPEHSWFNGDAASVNSVHDRYKVATPNLVANTNAAKSGSEMRGGNDNFSIQADRILSETLIADHVEVVLGGNDLCSRGCVDLANCDDPLYTEEQWRSAVEGGLEKLSNGLPSGSTVVLGSVPRVQDIRAAGIAKETGNPKVNCDAFWGSSPVPICRIVTNGDTMNGEAPADRLAGVASRQRLYNEVLVEVAENYNGVNGIEVIAEYTGEDTANAGTFEFGKDDIDGGDCFHPSIQGQNLVAEFMWNGNPDK